MKYRPEIDGLRTMAVVPVILFHLGNSWISGGYYGVDVFFVISGYLISTIIYNEIKTNSFSMKEFWLRRVRRIFPAILTVIVAILVVSLSLIYKPDIKSITTDALAALFSFANIHIWLNFGNYWGLSAENSFFLHAWSLSIEEQFYIFYPFLLFYLYKYNYSLKKWLIIIVLISVSLYLIGSKFYPTSTFYLLPTRAWELASGGLLALIIKENKIKKENNNLKSIISILGFSLIILSYFFSKRTEGINFFVILPVLGTLLIIGYSNTSNLIGKFLSLKPIVYIGKISYSLYLWHWPIIVLLKSYYLSKISNFELQYIAIILTIILSILSYHFIENPTRKWKETPKLVLGCLPFLVGFIFILKSPIINKNYKSDFNKTQFYGFYYDITPNPNPIPYIAKGVIIKEREEKYKEAYKMGGINKSTIDGNPNIIVLGDSHGAMWAKTIDEISTENQLNVTFYTAIANGAFFNLENINEQDKTGGFTESQRVSYALDFISKLKLWKPKLLIIACRWDVISEKNFKRMEDLISLTKKIGTRVLILNQPPLINTIGDRNSVQYLTFLGYKPNNNYQYIKHNSEIEKINLILKRRFSKYSNVSFFDVYSKFVENQNTSNALVIINSDILYYDDDHLSFQGTTLLKKELNNAITEIFQNIK